MLDFINIIDDYSKAFFCFAGLNGQEEFILILLVANEAHLQIFTVLEHAHGRAARLLHSVLHLEAILLNELVLEDADHLAQLLVLLSILYDDFS